MKKNLYSLKINSGYDSLEFSGFTEIVTDTLPPAELFHYGLEVTEKGKLVLFGGVKVQTTFKRRVFNLASFSELWVVNLNISNMDFNLINMGESLKVGGGYSKIISLGGEKVCIVNDHFPGSIMIVDFEFLSVTIPSTKMSVNDKQRSGYGAISLNGSRIMILGGHYENIAEVSEVDSNLFIEIFSIDNAIISQSNDLAITLGSTFSVSFAVLGVLALFVFIKKKRSKKQEVKMTPTIPEPTNSFDVEMDVVVLDNSEGFKASPSKHSNTSTIKSDKTLNPTFSGLYIPAYKTLDLLKDFRIDDMLCEGGYSRVFLGHGKAQSMKKYGYDDQQCVIKIFKKKVGLPAFLQELSVYEMFHAEKYFAKLICFSEDPRGIILKYYSLGSLEDFIFKKKEYLHVEYSFKNILFISQKITCAINLMHTKGIIHNDIKSDNILLDADQVEAIFPVITDFGAVKILSSAEMVQGFEIIHHKVCTNYYAAPEVLLSFKQKDYHRVSNVKTDIYSIGAVFGELYIRKTIWKVFDKNKVINGETPLIGLENILSQWPEIDHQTGMKLFSLIMDCLEYIPDRRPELNEVDSLLCSIVVK